MQAVELFNAGRLTEAIAAANEHVKKHPGEIDGRSFLCELLCFSGELERADKLLGALSALSDESTMQGTLNFRQILRAAVARRDVFEAGGVPNFIGPPGVELQERLRAVVSLREQSEKDAASALTKAEQQRQPKSGLSDTGPFSDLKDLDDLTGSILEVLTTTGKYYWVSFSRILSLEFEPLKFARDQLWRPAKVDIKDGPQQGGVYIPAIYQGSEKAKDDDTRLGRVTRLHHIGEKAKRCYGRRIWILGMEERSILEIDTVAVTQAESGTVQPKG